ncbi:MAG: NHLP bacteriocin system secretion protein [Desulfobacteraceae bacterium]|nr:NHLP bacteriocin system secretion protein [Desulfobacteraceae bacterium]
MFKNIGELIQPGESLSSIESDRGRNNPLSVFAFFHLRDGKKLRHGMKIKIVPSTIKVEEQGYMLGSIHQISRFPASQKGMFRVLQNQMLVASFTAQGPPIAVIAELLPDPAEPNRYQWSSGKGADITMESGTLCTVSVIISRQAPIRLVLP